MTESFSSTDSDSGLPRAVAFSLVFHVLLLLLLMVMPVSEPAADPRQEELITVTFESETDANSRPEPSELFKVTGEPPEDPTDSTPPPATLGDPRFLPAEGDPGADQLQQEAPDLEEVEPVEGEEAEDAPDDSRGEPAEDAQEVGDPKDPGTRDLPEGAAG